jgi:hypothetical protein
VNEKSTVAKVHSPKTIKIAISAMLPKRLELHLVCPVKLKKKKKAPMRF